MNCSKMPVDQPRLLAASLVSVLFCAASCSTPGSSTPPGTGPDQGTVTGLSAQQQQGLQNERDRFLIAKYLELARQLRAEGKLDEARLQALKAKEIHPAHTETLDLLNQISAELKEPSGTVASLDQQYRRLQQIREERNRAEVESRVQSGKQHQSQGNLDAAIQEFRIARQNIEVGRYMDWGALKGRVDQALADAEKAREERDRERSEAELRETMQALREGERLAFAERQARVSGLTAASMRAFEMAKYSWAQDLAREALDVDPNSQVARNLHESATKALRETRKDSYIEEKRNELTKLLEANEDLRIPQTDILRIDDATWQRADKRVVETGAEVAVSPENQAMQSEIDKKVVGKLTFTEETGQFNEVVKLVTTVTGLPIIITPEAKKVIADEGIILKLTLVSPLPLRNFLNQMVSRSENLAWRTNHGVIEIATKAQAGGDVVLKPKDVRDLVFQMTEFTPPQIRDIPSGATEGGPRSGGESDAKVAYIEGDALVNAIKDATGAKYWEGEGGGTIEYVDAGYLIVKANPLMHRRVDQMLNDYRRFATAVVTIESKFLSSSENFLQEIGVDFRGIGGSGAKGSNATLDDITNGLDDNASRGLDNAGTQDPAGHPSSGLFYNDGNDGDIRGRTENFFTNPLGRALSTTGGFTASYLLLDDAQLQMILRAIEKSENIQVVNSQRLTVLNNERANVSILNQTSYVRDFDVEVAQSAFIADPKVDVIQDGVVLDVKPVISYDRKYVLLALQPTVAELIRPIPTFTTSLAGSTLPVTLQLPQLTVKTFATTAKVPDGGSVLLGGLREVLAVERRAEVPLLAQIPIVSFLFKVEGVVNENTAQMVLVRATITDVRESTERRGPLAR